MAYVAAIGHLYRVSGGHTLCASQFAAGPGQGLLFLSRHAAEENAPTFEQVSADFAKYRGQTDAAARLAGKLREGHIFGGINAHEQLTEESALTLVRWLIDGIK